MDFKKSIIVDEANLFELDKEQLKHIYKDEFKKHYTYNISEKQIFFAIKQDDQYSKENQEKRYYSDFKHFTKYFSSGFTGGNETLHEINELRDMLKQSVNLRKELEEITGIITKNDYMDLNEQISPDFLNSCKLLQPKLNKKNEAYKSEFTFYSELKNPVNPESIGPCFSYDAKKTKNDLKQTYNDIKSKLKETYLREEHFNDYAKNYFTNKKEGKDFKKLPSSPIHSPKSSPKMNKSKNFVYTNVNTYIEYIESMFIDRESKTYFKIDHFMGMYPDKRKKCVHESELFDNIYKFFYPSKINIFFSTLYSNNDLFKFIYDNFSQKKINQENHVNIFN